MSDCRRKLSNLTFDPETIAKGQENSGEWELDQKCVNVCVCVCSLKVEEESTNQTEVFVCRRTLSHGAQVEAELFLR